ncbi:MAG: carboxypeptidase-like regulatory domain-containing protein, partial [Acidobacteriota bacterium]
MLLRLRRTGVVYLLMVLAGITALHTLAAGQSQALNGQIEGIVKDANGSAVPGASITIRNIETGAERAVTSDADGVYRAPLLPLGTYRISVEAPNFKKLVRDGITLTAGQTATIDLGLEAG